jgi:thioredoxin-like negative regulator of GroEL
MVKEIDCEPREALRKVPAAIVVFYAPWCGDSKASLEFEKVMEGEFDGQVQFYRLDATECEQIADKYNVERYPTYVFFRKGKPDRSTLVEPYSEDEVRNWIEIRLSRRR